MANAEIIKQMGNTVDRLVDKVTEKNAAPLPVVPHDNEGSTSRAVDAISTGYEKAFDIIGKGLAQAHERSEKNQDPMEHTKQVIELAKSLIPTPPSVATTAAPSNDPIVAALLEDRKAQREEISELRKMYTVSLEARLAAAEARAVSPAATTNPLETFMGMLKAFSSAKELWSIAWASVARKRSRNPSSKRSLRSAAPSFPP